MQFLDKDMMKWRLVGPSGVTFYYANEAQLKLAVCEGESAYTRLASYVISPSGRFLKNRTIGIELPNAILGLGRDKINELFNFMEGKQ